MRRYFIRRLIITVPTLLLISLIIFSLMDLAPGDPTSNLPLTTRPEVREQIRETLGFNQPFHQRYVRWLRQFFIYEPLNLLESITGMSFGEGQRLRMTSWSSRGKPVVDLISERFPQTWWIVSSAYAIALLIAIPVGTLSAINQRSLFDRLSTTLSLVLYAIPSFFIALILIIIFSVKLGWLPSIYDTTLKVTNFQTFVAQIKQMLMPVTVLAIMPTVALIRFTRAAVLDTLHKDYIRTAKAKGLHRYQIISHHILRNSLIPVVTIVALGIPASLGGAVIVEQIFRINGLGTLLITSIQQTDIPVVTTITFLLAILVVIFNIIADIIYAILNPQIRYQ